jgi:hypothetical protein
MIEKNQKVPLLLLLIFSIAIVWVLLHRSGNLPAPTPATTSPYADFTVHIPQKALLKNYLVVSLEAAPGTNCKLTYVPPSGEIQEMNTIANEDGLCKWRWKIDEAHGAGDGRLIFTVDGASDTHYIQIFAEF